MKTYKIMRSYAPKHNKSSTNRHIGGLTLEEAQKHCQQTDTHKEGEWFDFYTEE